MHDDQHLPEEEGGYGLLMPFVVCESNGGPYDDVSFTAGYELGRLDVELRTARMLCATPSPRFNRTASVPQLDLVAMRHGFISRIDGVDASGEWSWVTFTLQEEMNDDE